MLLWLIKPSAGAAWTPNDLTIIELKMTGSESIFLENTGTSPLNLQNYLLEYFNKPNPTSLTTPTSTQQLPNISLAPKQALLLSGDNNLTCGASAVANLSFALSDTSGYLEIMRVEANSDGSLTYRPQDHASWTSTTSGADILKVPSNTADPQAVWYRNLADGTWQQAELNGCAVLLSIVAPSSDPTFVQWTSGSPPSVTFVSAASDSNGGVSLPASDIGLAAPFVNELLPNPAEPQTDSEDEFIELYNPNNTAFDLSGFKLQVGTTTTHSYSFPSGTNLPAKSFVAFYSIDTGLALSNSGGQARLLDPFGNVVTQSDVYGTAKDGQAWAYGNGQWYWTLTPTPDAANIINQPLTTKTLSIGSAAAKKSTATKTKATKVKSASAKKSVIPSSVPDPNVAAKTDPVNSLILAGIGSAALVYAGYEYRHDLANQIYRLRRNRAARRAVGEATETAGSS